MKDKDKVEKLLEDYDDVFADIVNTLLFDGASVIKEDSLEDSKVNSIYKAEDFKLHEQERDISKYWKDGGLNLLIIGIENQTRVDRLMPARIIGYDGASYRSQLLKTDDKGNKTRIAPVVTIVLYFGTTRWNRPKSLKGILDIPRELDNYVNDYKINVFEIAFLPEEKVRQFKSDFGVVARYFTSIRKDPYYVPENENEIRHVDAVLKFLSIMSGSEDIIEKIVTKKGSEVRDMTGGPLSQLYYKGVREGREEGLEQGIEQGVNETLLKVYINCRKKGMSIEESEDIVHFAERESLDRAEEEFQRMNSEN
jgi:hypothetical protein